jgi:hypothetical protein
MVQREFQVIHIMEVVVEVLHKQETLGDQEQVVTVLVAV